MKPLLQIVRGWLWHSRNRVIEKVCRWGGRFLYGTRMLWLNDMRWLEPYEKYLEADRLPDKPKTRILDRRFVLIKFAESVRRLDGSSAECGVREGVGSALICKALEGTYREGSRHYGFDSFEGLPEPSARDAMASGVNNWRKGGLSRQLEDAQRYLADFPTCTLVKGWIPESLDTVRDEVFRFVHIDVDLHSSTSDSLAFFYPRMVDGGIMLFDDYGTDTCLGARAAVDEFFAGTPESVLELPSGQGFVICRAAGCRRLEPRALAAV